MMQRYRNQRKALSFLALVYGVRLRQAKKITADKRFIVVPRVGREPTHLAAGDFESPASTNFATWAGEEVAIIAAYSGL